MKSRKSTKRALVVAVLAAIGTAGIGMSTASAANVIANGAYNLVITTTPTYTHKGKSVPSVGSTGSGASAGAWNSSFTFGGNAPSTSSQAMTDNNETFYTNGGYRGSSIGGDGWAGILGVTVNDTSLTVNGLPSMSGTITQTTGDMTLNPTTRLGAVSNFPSLYDEAWNINGGSTTYQTFSTVSAKTSLATIWGTAFTALSGTPGAYAGTLVSGGQVGSAWGGFANDGYFEVWKVELLPVTAANQHSGYNVDVIKGTAGGDFAEYVGTTPAPVPIPAAAWLFGSGLIGLVGIARRKKSS